MKKINSIRAFTQANINKRLYLRSFFREVEAQYQHLCDHDVCSIPLSFGEGAGVGNLGNYTKLIEEIAQQIQSGELKPSDLDSRLVEQIYNDVSEPVKKELGKQWINYDYKEPGNLIQKFKKNLWQFSCAKTLVELEMINSLLIDKNGRIKPEHQFMQDVRKMNVQYNKNYLQAEYQTAKRGAQMAHLWTKFQEQKHLFPNLVYRTVGDGRVRPEHATLSGIVKPIDDPFWRTYYPPNGWRCRCTVMNTAEKVTEGEFEDKTVKPEFHGNTALDEEILTSKVSFFKLLNKDFKAKINAELLKYNMPMDIAYHGKHKKKVFVSPYADTSDLIPNVETARVIVDHLGIDVKIRAHINLQNHKNPEYEINGKLADRKETSSYTSIKSNLETARKQGNQSIVYDITKFKDWKASEITKNLKGKIMNYKQADWLHEIYFVNGNKAISFTKDELLKDYVSVLKKLESIKSLNP
ncbi:phage minor head protein [Capnocytophaga sp. ARDL2]|uniref:phage minor head protein n=1 Tax=Capnocytophaga sp. ARDL2 TaxID=3238809 RepID=UPI003556B5ED